ncbi:RIB43A-like with coiled-coils protein 2 [Myotis lucifugus]|nr:RIB43A-like with coiled-coils protein 2 [Myotis lucifugus]
MDIVQPNDLEQSFCVARRRHAELCRQNQIFNARNRILGGDTKTWDIQVCDRKIKEATEKARHETFEDLYTETRLQFDQRAQDLEHRERATRRAVSAAVKQFNKTQRLQEEQRQRDADWDRQRVEKARAEVLCERQQRRQQRDLRRALDSSNRILAAEQLRQRNDMKEVCTNQATDDFFTQFNTRSR